MSTATHSNFKSSETNFCKPRAYKSVNSSETKYCTQPFREKNQKDGNFTNWVWDGAQSLKNLLL